MRKIAFSAILVLTGLLLVAIPLRGQSSPLEGTWRLNVAKSKYSPGPPPKSQTLRWERIAGGFRFTTDTVTAQGQTTHTETIEKDDGSEAPVQGAQTPTTRFLKRQNSHDHGQGHQHPGAGRKQCHCA
jgi:hypothetical protein